MVASDERFKVTNRKAPRMDLIKLRYTAEPVSPSASKSKDAYRVAAEQTNNLASAEVGQLRSLSIR